MSDKATDSTNLTAEQNVEVVQESPQSSNEESGVQALADANQPQVKDDVLTKRSGSFDADETKDEVVNPGESNRHQSNIQDNFNIDDGSTQDSQKSLLPGGAEVMESQQSGLDDGSSNKLQGSDSISGTEIQVDTERHGTESQQGGATIRTEPEQVGAKPEPEQVVATGGAKPEPEQVVATGGAEPEPEQVVAVPEQVVEEPQPELMGATGGAEPELMGATGGAGGAIPKRRDLQESFESSKTGDWQETAFVSGTSPRDSMSSAGGAIPKRRVWHDSVESSKSGDSQETAVVSDTNRRVSIVSEDEGISNRPVSQGSIESSKTGDSAETALVCDLSRQNSFESGVGDVISNNLQEGMAAPTQAWLPWWSERIGQNYAPRSYEQCFHYCSNVCDLMRPISRRILKSDSFKAIRFFLLLMAILVFSMGTGHLSDCAASIELPFLVMGLGGVGIVLLVGSLAMDDRRHLCPNYHVLLLRAGMILARLVFLGLFGAVLHFTYTISPSFNVNKADYCNEMLYYFTYYANFVIGAIVVAAFCIYVPTLNDDEIHYEQI